MASSARLESLTKRHQELEADIASETKHPAFDEDRVLRLKREKLRIKDTLEGIRSGLKPH